MDIVFFICSFNFYVRLYSDAREKIPAVSIPAGVWTSLSGGHNALLETLHGGCMTWPIHQGIYDAGDVTLQSGDRLPSARLSWQTHGMLSPQRDNVIVYPTSYGAQHPDLGG